MDIKLSDYEKDRLPLSFRVIGVGKETAEVIECVNSMGYDGLEGIVAADDTTVSPTELDKMVILVTTSADCSRLEPLAKTFYQAGVLTIVVAASEPGLPDDCYDSLTVVEAGKIPAVLHGLLDPIFLHGCVDYGFSDLSCTLKNTGSFMIADARGDNPESRMDDAVKAIINDTKHFEQDIENMSLLIYCNVNLTPRLSMDELSAISKLVEELPVNLNMIWAVIYNNSLPETSLRLTAIVSGKRD